MHMKLSIGQRLEQKLKLAPQIIQSIEILQMNVADLRQKVEEEMLENPIMELEEEERGQDQDQDQDQDNEQDQDSEQEDSDRDEESDQELMERELERIESMQESWKEISESRRSYSGEKDRKLEAMNNAPERDETLQEHVITQLHTLGLPERAQAIGEFLAYNLDDKGYLRTQSVLTTDGAEHFDQNYFDGGEISEDFAIGIGLEPPATPEEVEEVLHLIQELDPPGVGARNLMECLLIQIGMAEEYSLERTIVRDHLEDVMKNRLPRIAKATGEPIELVDEAIRFIRALNPHPGAIYTTSKTQYVVPDIVVQQRGGEWQVQLEDTYIPHIRISPQYLKLYKEKGEDPKISEYVKRKIDSAKSLMEAIEQRQATLRKIAQEIVDYQRDFFEIGVDALKPLKMQYIADQVGVHVSTVSRAISGKYMQTPRGIFSLRYFFKGGVTTADGDELSVVAIKEKIKTMIEKEDKSSPLSDEEVATRLKEDGLDIARRTVAKYRTALSIPSSRQRRRFAMG